MRDLGSLLSMSSFFARFGNCSLLGFPDWESAPGRKPGQMWDSVFLLLSNIVLSQPCACKRLLHIFCSFFFKWESELESCYSSVARSTILCFYFNWLCWKFLVASYVLLVTLCEYCGNAKFMRFHTTLYIHLSFIDELNATLIKWPTREGHSYSKITGAKKKSHN